MNSFFSFIIIKVLSVKNIDIISYSFSFLLVPFLIRFYAFFGSFLQ